MAAVGRRCKGGPGAFSQTADSRSDTFGATRRSARTRRRCHRGTWRTTASQAAQTAAPAQSAAQLHSVSPRACSHTPLPQTFAPHESHVHAAPHRALASPTHFESQAALQQAGSAAQTVVAQAPQPTASGAPVAQRSWQMTQPQSVEHASPLAQVVPGGSHCSPGSSRPLPQPGQVSALRRLTVSWEMNSASTTVTWPSALTSLCSRHGGSARNPTVS